MENEEVTKAIQTMLQEISNLKKDVSYLSGKVGLHEMYLHRIENEEKQNEERESEIKAEELFARVKSMENGERLRFLIMMYNAHFRKPGQPEWKEEDTEF